MHKKNKFSTATLGSIIAVVLAVIVCCLLYFAENRVPVLESGGESTPSSGILNYDFQASGVVVQTQQYGKCNIQITGSESTAIVYQFGKNLWGGKEVSKFPRNNKGISYSKAEDGSIIATGTAEGNSMCWTSGKWGEGTTNADRIFLQEGTYTFSGCPAGGSDSTYRQRLAVIDSEGKETYYHDYGEGVTFFIKEPAYVASYIEIKSGVVVNDLRFAPQLEIGTQATEYEKYRGKQYTVELVNGVGTLDIKGASAVEFHTYMSTETSLTVNGFGELKNCVAPIWHASQPHFAIVDDDGKDDVYSVLYPLLNNRGIPFSTAVIPTRLNEKGFLTVEQLHEIVNAGNKVLCHSKNHLNLLNKVATYEERCEEILGGKQMLEALGFETNTMVYPNGAFNDEVLEITKSAYQYGLATGGRTAWGEQRYNKDPIDLYVIERVNIGSYYKGETAEERAKALEDAKKNIDVCIEKNRLCVIMTHIGDADDEGIAQIVELINYVESKGYKFVDLDTALEAHTPPVEQ